jgi:hypothetical protein
MSRMVRHIKQAIQLNLTLNNGLPVKVLKETAIQMYLFFNNPKVFKYMK